MKKQPPPNKITSMDEARSSRNLHALNTLPISYTWGSLWWVDELIWKEKVTHYDPNSTRKSHPGLSLRRYPLTTPYEMIPMLHGTSKKNRASIQVQGTCGDKNRTTYFGKIRPVDIKLSELFSTVKPNSTKPTLNEQEMHELTEWAIQQGVI